MENLRAPRQRGSDLSDERRSEVAKVGARRGRPRVCPHDPELEPEYFRRRTRQQGKYTIEWMDCLECKRALERAKRRTKSWVDQLDKARLRRVVYLLTGFTPGPARQEAWDRLMVTVERLAKDEI